MQAGRRAGRQACRQAGVQAGRQAGGQCGRVRLPCESSRAATAQGTGCPSVLPTACPPVQVVPVLRAGLVLLEQAFQVLPSSETYHVGYVRDEETLKAT